jgi:dephospho-CoA kinase
LLESELRQKIQNRFGAELYAKGTLDRAVLAKRVFQDPQELKELNEIVHPAVAKAFEKFKVKHKDAPIVIKEAAILFESGGDKFCDSVVLITAPKELRIQRVLERDGGTRSEVLKRMSQQWSDEQKKKKADWVIENIDLSKTIEQVETILMELKN